MRSYTSFYDNFRPLCTKRVAIEHVLKVKLGQNLTNQGLGFGRDVGMASLFIQRCANLLKINNEGDIKQKKKKKKRNLLPALQLLTPWAKTHQE